MKAIIKEILEELAAGNNGILKPEDIIDHAKNPESPLHSCFEWSDKKAGHQYRLDQARNLIRSVRVTITTEKRELSSVYYVRDPNAEPDKQGYVSLPQLRSDKDLAHEALVAEFSRAASALRRAREIAEALGLESEVDSVIASVNLYKQRVVAWPERLSS